MKSLWVAAAFCCAVFLATTAFPSGVAADDAEADESSSNAESPDPRAIARGKRLYVFCQACHSTDANSDNKIGPHLAGIIDRPVAALETAIYSDELKAQDFAWTEEKLDMWLEKPSEMIPGTIMGFVGIPQPELRSSLIAYLKTL